MLATKARPTTFDECLASARPEHRVLLEKLRRAVHAAAPGLEEGVSYGLAAFRWNGRPLMAFGSWANHCALYPMSSTTLVTFANELKDFETTKGTIRFTAEKPLSMVLLKKLVRARIAESVLNPRRRPGKSFEHTNHKTKQEKP